MARALLEPERMMWTPGYPDFSSVQKAMDEVQHLKWQSKSKELPATLGRAKAERNSAGSDELKIGYSAQGQTFEGAYSSREYERDEQVLEVGRESVKVEPAVLELDLKKGKFVAASQVKVEGSAIRWIERPSSRFTVVMPTTVCIPVPMAARLGDPTLHGTPLGPGVGSANVFIEGRPAWRGVIDQHLCPLAAPLAHGAGSAVGEASVRINGFPAVRAGDPIAEPQGGPNPVMSGAVQVLIGAPAPAVDAVVGVDQTLARVFVVETEPPALELLYVEATGKAGGAAGGGQKLGLEAGLKARASAIRRQYKGKIGVRNPWTEEVYRTLEYDVSLHFFSYGGEAKVGGVSKPGTPSVWHVDLSKLRLA